MTSDDADYYRGRAATERLLAKSAANIYARRAHRELADNYEILWRMLCAGPPGRARAQGAVGDDVGFTTLMQTLATPRSADLIYAHARPPAYALDRPAAPLFDTAPVNRLQIVDASSS